MAKKQRRYSPADLKKALPDLAGRSMSLILQGGQVHHLKIMALENGKLIASDGLSRIHRFPLQDIEEVIEEKHA